MHTRVRRVALEVIAVAVVAIAGGVTYAVAEIGGGGVINGCYKAMNGELRVIDPATDRCLPSETPISWSQTGPQGPKGDPGPAGLAGTSGTALARDKDNQRPRHRGRRCGNRLRLWRERNRTGPVASDVPERYVAGDAQCGCDSVGRARGCSGCHGCRLPDQRNRVRGVRDQHEQYLGHVHAAQRRLLVRRHCGKTVSGWHVSHLRCATVDVQEVRSAFQRTRPKVPLALSRSVRASEEAGCDLAPAPFALDIAMPQKGE
jgi:hypothetical protein